MREHKIGIIGYGFMGKTHTLGYKSIPLFYSDLPYTVKLGGICTRRIAIAEQAKEQQGFEYATDNADDIFNDPDIDIVSICTPNNSHKDYILRALKAGKNIYCDKPLTANASESEEVMAELEKHPKLITQTALQCRFYPAIMRAKQLMDEGRIGRVYHFRCEYLHSSGCNQMKTIGWKQQKEYGGGGVLLDLGAHAFDLVYHLLGVYDSVYTTKDIFYSQRPDKNGDMIDVDAEDAALSLVRMKSGARGEVFVSKIATGSDDELSIDIRGEKGAIKFNTMEPGYLYFYDADAKDGELGGDAGFTRISCHQKFPEPGGHFPSPKSTIGFLRAHVACLYNFIDCVDKGIKASPSFADGAYIQSVMELCYESEASGQWKAL